MINNTFIAEVTFPAWYASRVTQTSDSITYGACVEASLRTIIPEKSTLASWFKKYNTKMNWMFVKLSFIYYLNQSMSVHLRFYNRTCIVIQLFVDNMWLITGITHVLHINLRHNPHHIRSGMFHLHGHTYYRHDSFHMFHCMHHHRNLRDTLK